MKVAFRSGSVGLLAADRTVFRRSISFRSATSSPQTSFLLKYSPGDRRRWQTLGCCLRRRSPERQCLLVTDWTPTVSLRGEIENQIRPEHVCQPQFDWCAVLLELVMPESARTTRMHRPLRRIRRPSSKSSRRPQFHLPLIVASVCAPRPVDRIYLARFRSWFMGS